MAEIKVTSEQLKSKASELRQLNNQFKKAVEDMTSNEQQLVGMWDGETKEAFHNAYNSDKSQMDVFYSTIEKYCQALETNAQKYESAEQKNLNTASTRTYK
jgi:WXG100 family type VII secretion target